MKYALVFPGQGSQQVGMGRDLHDRYSAAKRTFDEADEALGFSLSSIIFQGPEEKLTLTAYTQPAILTVSIAVYRCLTEELGLELRPEFVAGHSLGEYTALVASGVLSLADGVRLVHNRGTYMQEAVPEGRGAMAAILGMTVDDVELICADAAQGQVCEPANYNTPAQLVISGEVEAVSRAVELAQQRGAKRAVMLNVSAPFHCSLMRPVADRLADSMDSCQWYKGSVPLVANVSAAVVHSVKSIRDGLYEQTYSAVQWIRSVQTMVGQDVNRFIEVGPGKVLTGIIKKIHKGGQCLSVETLDELEKVAPFIAEETSENGE